MAEVVGRSTWHKYLHINGCSGRREYLAKVLEQGHGNSSLFNLATLLVVPCRRPAQGKGALSSPGHLAGGAMPAQGNGALPGHLAGGPLPAQGNGAPSSLATLLVVPCRGYAMALFQATLLVVLCGSSCHKYFHISGCRARSKGGSTWRKYLHIPGCSGRWEYLA